jgi:hypothetical protein
MTFVELMALDSKSMSTVPSPVKPALQQGVQSESNPASPAGVTGGGTASTAHEAKPARKRATKTAANHATMTSGHHDTTTPRLKAELVSRLREAVKPLGKEGATHRFTPEEKERLAEIVYQYHRRGLRSSENEIVRVAIHWLLEDHAARGEEGILHRVLLALHE